MVERKRRKSYPQDPQHDMLRGEAIDQKLREEWRIHRASKILEKERETRQAAEELLE